MNSRPQKQQWRRLALAATVLLGLGGCRKPDGACGCGKPAPADKAHSDRVTGVAQNAKLGALVASDKGAVYCAGLREWPADVVGTTVTVEGVLTTTDAFKATVAPDGAISQGTAGGDQVLEKCVRVGPDSP